MNNRDESLPIRLVTALSIRMRLIALVCAALAPLLALLAFAAADVRSTALAHEADEIGALARLASERRGRILDEARTLLTTLRDTTDVSVAGGAACDETLSRAAARNPKFMTIGVVAPTGMLTCHSKHVRQRFGDPATLAASEAAVDRNAMLLGRMIIGPVTGRPTLIAGLPFEDGGMLFASLDLSGFGAVADGWNVDGSAETDLATGRTVTILDATDQRIVADSDPTRIGRPIANNPVTAAILAAPKGGVIEAANFLGEDSIVGFAPIHVSGPSRPVAVVSVPRSRALAAANQLAIQSLVGAATVAVAALVLTWIIGDLALARPISSLSATAERIGRGELSARSGIAPWQARELRSLGSTIDVMASRLDIANRQLESLANEDGLTGLANRRRFDAVLEAECARAHRSREPLSLLLIDVDHFKAFNDHHGHMAGDDCLRRLAQCVKEGALRPGDVAARYGGEEFALILPRTDTAGALVIAQRLIAAVREADMEHSHSMHGRVTVSVGGDTYSSWRSGPPTPATIIAAADAALYRAKAGGRNGYRGAPTVYEMAARVG